MNDTLPGAIDALDAALWRATTEIRADVLLLGGGVDSAVIAAMWRKQGHSFRAITVGRSASLSCVSAHECLPYPCNSDLAWSQKVATELDLKWLPVELDEHEALTYLDRLIVQQRSFDLGQLNNIALYTALDSLGESTTFASGDDGDGLFGGYLNAGEHADWGAWVAQRIPYIDPPARGIGVSLGWESRFPYLHPAVLEVAKGLTAEDIREARLEELPPSFMDQFDPQFGKEHQRIWGKVVLRKVAERYLPHKLAWRPKTDLEFGSGMCALERSLAALMTDDTRAMIDRTGMQFFNDAHRGLYLRFMECGGAIPEVRAGEAACPNCGASRPIGKNHCHTCGYWQANG